VGKTAKGRYLPIRVSEEEINQKGAIRPLDQPDPLSERVAKATSIDNLTN
jgi:hypothetical protein